MASGQPGQVRIDIAQLDPAVPPVRLDAWLDGAGASTRLVRLDMGEAMPSCDGVVVLGGRMDAYCENDHPCVAAALRVIESCLHDERPLLAICLGHQLLARVAGGHVEVGALDPPEGGAHTVDWAPDAACDPVMAPVLAASAGIGNPSGVSWVAQSHWDVVDRLPTGARPLASSPGCAVQAFRLGAALGVQFHPEADPELIAHWARNHGPDAVERESRSVRDHDEAIAAVGRALTRAFVQVSSTTVHASAR